MVRPEEPPPESKLRSRINLIKREAECGARNRVEGSHFAPSRIVFGVLWFVD